VTWGLFNAKYKDQTEGQMIYNTICSQWVSCINETGNVRTNVILRCVCLTIFAMEKQQALLILILCLQPSLSSTQSACTILHCYLRPVPLHHVSPHYLRPVPLHHVSPHYLRPVPLHHVSPHYLTNGTIFGKTLLNIKCVLIFSAKSVWNNSLSQKNSATHHNECIVFMWSAAVLLRF